MGYTRDLGLQQYSGLIRVTSMDLGIVSGVAARVVDLWDDVGDLGDVEDPDDVEDVLLLGLVVLDVGFATQMADGNSSHSL